MLAIPDSILMKPGPLDYTEWSVMRRHAEDGARKLSGAKAPLIQMAERIARCHHERWDGAGYPSALRGDEIPLEARIVAVCDAFDVMTTNQRYRAAVGVEEAAREIEANSGTQFDPEVVAAFLAALPEVTQLYRRLSTGGDDECSFP